MEAVKEQEVADAETGKVEDSQPVEGAEGEELVRDITVDEVLDMALYDYFEKNPDELVAFFDGYEEVETGDTATQEPDPACERFNTALEELLAAGAELYGDDELRVVLFHPGSDEESEEDGDQESGSDEA